MYAKPERQGKLQSQHHAIWKALREHKPEAAAKAARQHIEIVQQSIAETAKEKKRRSSTLKRMGAEGQA